MDLPSILAAVGESAAEGVLSPHWDESAATYPAAGPGFLEPDTVVATRRFTMLEASADHELLAAAAKVRESAALSRLAWHCHRLAFDHLDYSTTQFRGWPDLVGALGELSGAFYLLIGLQAVPRMQRVHQRLGVPESVSMASCSHFPEATGIYREHHGGHYGLLPKMLGWLRNHIRGDLYRVGRFEYMLKPFGGRLRAYRNCRTHAVAALAEAGVSFDSDGYVAAPGEGWEATFAVTPETVSGVLIDPRGHATRRTVSLPLAEWRLVLAPGDLILETHIPTGGGMTPALSKQSMQDATEFFARHFPDRPCRAFACHSWILNPQLARIYRPDSNMVLWQRELYLFPVPCGHREGLYFIFGTDTPDVSTAPRDNSLRRALLDHAGEGGRLMAGGMFMLTDDLATYGDEIYRRRWDSTFVNG